MLDDKLKLKDNEKILFITRPSLKSYIVRFLIFFLFATGISFFYFFLIFQGFYGVLIVSSMIFLWALYGLQCLAIYYYNVYVVTNLRIIGIEQKGLFARVIMAIEIKCIDDINFFKGNRLYVKLLDGNNLIIDKIEEKEYFYETIKNLVEWRKTGNRKIDFVMRRL